MCLACQMEDELWLAYLDQVARQDKAVPADAAEPPKAGTKAETKAELSASFVCEELPSE
jgi:hypothetical protein